MTVNEVKRYIIFLNFVWIKMTRIEKYRLLWTERLEYEN